MGTAVELHGRKAGIDLATKRIFTEGRAFSMKMTPAAGSSNISLVTMQVVDYYGNAVKGVFNFDWWLSDATDGGGLTATTASGAVAAGTAGIDLVVMTSKKATRSQTKNDGSYIASITDSAKTAFKVCAQGEGFSAVPGVTLATGNFG